VRVSVVIPTFNRLQLLGASVDSALSQTGVEVDVVVVDDGSTDGTENWLAQAYGGMPVQLLRNAGLKGPAGGRNTGLQAASGDFVALLDSDDRFLPGHLSAAVGVMTRHSGVDVVFGRARYLQGGAPVPYMGPNFTLKLGLAPKAMEDDEMTLFGPGFFDHLLEHGCWFNLSSVVLSRAAAQQHMREDLRVAEDYEYWVRLSRTLGFACLKREQIEYTLGDDNISFESDTLAEGHAPQMLRAYRHMLGYETLTPRQRRLIEFRMAGELFDWGYRAGSMGRSLQSIQLHARSWAFGLRARNTMAICKTTLRAVASRVAPGKRL
jgi:glycosyltransferase involved in cell wall biosynthesis